MKITKVIQFLRNREYFFFKTKKELIKEHQDNLDYYSSLMRKRRLNMLSDSEQFYLKKKNNRGI